MKIHKTELDESRREGESDIDGQPLIIEPVRHALDLSKIVGKRALECTFPLLVNPKEYQGTDKFTFDFAASAVLVQIDSVNLVLTANHTMRETNPANACMYYNLNAEDNEVNALDGTYWSTKENEIGQDELDIGFIVKDRNFSDCAESAFEITDSEERYFSNKASVFVVCGFPSSRQVLRPGSPRAKFKMTRIIAYESSVVGSYNKSKHLVLKYDRKQQARNDGSGTRMGVEPTGMSGCGVFQVTLLPESDQYSVRLAGILTDYHKKEKVLVATRLNVLLSSQNFQIAIREETNKVSREL